MKIINIKISDLDEVFELINKCSKKLESEGYFHWKRYKKENLKDKIINSNCYGIEFNNKIIGFVSLHKKEQSFINNSNVNSFTGNKDYIYFSALAILPEYQNKGYAGKLIDFIISFVRKEGIKYLRMAYISNNKRLKLFYKKKGFKNVYEGFVEEVNNNVTFGELIIK